MDLFTRNNYQLTIARIIAGTGLSLAQVKKAIRDFKKDKVIYSMQDFQSNKVILLREPYRSNLASLNTPAIGEEKLNLETLRQEMMNRRQLSGSELVRRHDITADRAEDLLEQLADKMSLITEIDAKGERIYRLN